jgi:hypothetical protein
VDVSALGKFGFPAFCLQVKLRGKNFYLHSFSWEVIDISGARISKDIVFNSIRTPPASFRSSLQPLLMLSWFLELEHVGNGTKIGITPGKGLSHEESLCLLLSKPSRSHSTSRNFQLLI